MLKLGVQAAGMLVPGTLGPLCLCFELCVRPQVLNGYVDGLGRGARTDGARLEFWVSEAGALARLEADLPPHGSLGALFYAFGLISAEDLRSGAGTYATGALCQPIKRALTVSWRGHSGSEQGLTGWSSCWMSPGPTYGA